VIKIDRRWVHGAHSNPVKLQALKRLVAVGRALDCVLMAEGIETELDLETVIACGIAYGQGFLWGRPA